MSFGEDDLVEMEFAEEAGTLDYLELCLRDSEWERTIHVECPVGELARRLRQLLPARFKHKQVKVQDHRVGRIVSAGRVTVFLPLLNRTRYDFRHVTHIVRYIPEFWKRETEQLKLAGDYACMIQKININVELSREQLYELGRNGPYYRYLDFPAEAAGEHTEAIEDPGQPPACQTRDEMRNQTPHENSAREDRG